MPVFDMDPGQSPEAAGTLYFYEQGADPATGWQVTSKGVVSAAGALNQPVAIASAAATTDSITTRVTGDADPRFIVNADGKLEWGSGTGAADCTLYRYAATGLAIDGALRLTNDQMLFGAGGDVNLYRGGADLLKTDDGLIADRLQVREGANATMGVAVLVAGGATVSTTKVTANSRIFMTVQVPGGTVGSPRVASRIAGTSFTIASSQGADTSTVGWFLVEPSA